MFVQLGDQSLRWSRFHEDGPRIQMELLHVGSVSGCQSLGQGILADAITTVPRGQRSYMSAPEDY
jgi:hypothetical protein